MKCNLWFCMSTFLQHQPSAFSVRFSRVPKNSNIKTKINSCMRICFFYRKNLTVCLICLDEILVMVEWSDRRSAFPLLYNKDHRQRRISCQKMWEISIALTLILSFRFLNSAFFLPAIQLHKPTTLANRCERSSWEDRFDSIELNRKMILQFWPSLLRCLRHFVFCFGHSLLLDWARQLHTRSDRMQFVKREREDPSDGSSHGRPMKLFVQHMVLRFLILTPSHTTAGSEKYLNLKCCWPHSLHSWRKSRNFNESWETWKLDMWRCRLYWKC